MQQVNLDVGQLYQEIDAEGMLQKIGDLPQQLENAWDAAQEVAVPRDYREIANVVIAGMGGSAIGGDLAREFLANQAPLPIFVNRDYTLPAFVGIYTLLIASSYSGNTEETLTAFEIGVKRKAKLIAITSGGRLADRAQELGIPLFPIRYSAQPRAALGHSLIPLLAIMDKLGYGVGIRDEVREAVEAMAELTDELTAAVPEVRNPAKQVARRLYGRIPVIYAATPLTSVARRWKGQINENAKGWAFFELLPELNHNAVAGYPFPEDVQDHVAVVFLRSRLEHPRNQRRFEITRRLLEERGVPVVEVHARGEGRLAQMMTALLFGDYVSYYLAVLSRVDPSPVETIQRLKAALSAGGAR